jgi:ABC-type transporter MlaC component
MNYFRIFLIIFAIIFLPQRQFTDDDKSPLKILKDAIKITQDVVRNLPENFSEEQEKEAKEKIRSKLEPLLDQDKASELSISSKNWTKFSEKQKVEFKENLKKILVQKFSAIYKKEKTKRSGKTNIQKLKAIEINIKDEKKYNDKLLKIPKAVKISAIIPGDEIDLPVNFIFSKNKDSQWKIYDIHFDGKSIIYSYKKQFSSIIRKHGVDYLLKKLKEIGIKKKK